MNAAKGPNLGDVADALSDMIELADAWASAGPEGYTREERRRRTRADRVLGRLNRYLANAHANAGGPP